MIKKLMHSPTTAIVFVLVLFSAALNFYASKILNASYEASKFPVPYFKAQLSFSAEKIKGWYSYLIDEGTLGVYLKTQHIDFIFIISILLLHFFALLLISRLFATNSRGRKILIVCALISIIAPLADAIENLISYVMLANPENFADWLALIYSFFAAVKFVFFVFAYLAAAIGLIVGIFMWIKSKLTKTDNKPV